jgi:hypothetical protein
VAPAREIVSAGLATTDSGLATSSSGLPSASTARNTGTSPPMIIVPAPVPSHPTRHAAGQLTVSDNFDRKY